ncbi:hypothetical protein [Paraburkholderia piptadeniae]|nr:hypothetical protein [Paraburkholderia piptadeniae]
MQDSPCRLAPHGPHWRSFSQFRDGQHVKSEFPIKRQIAGLGGLEISADLILVANAKSGRQQGASNAAVLPGWFYAQYTEIPESSTDRVHLLKMRQHTQCCRESRDTGGQHHAQQ